MLSLRIPLPGGIHGMPWERHVVVRGSICGMEACARLARKGMPACRAPGHLSYPILVTLVTPPVVQIDLSTWQGGAHATCTGPVLKLAPAATREGSVNSEQHKCTSILK